MCGFKKVIIFLILSIAIEAYGDIVYGPCEYGKVTLGSLTCFGPAILNNTIIQGDLSVMGPLTMQNAEVHNMNIKGKVYSSHSNIDGEVSVYGPIVAENTRFNGVVFSATNIFILTNSSIKGDLSVQSEEAMPVVELNHTQINGDVNFTRETGVLKLDNSSKVSGQINNGKKIEK